MIIQPMIHGDVAAVAEIESASPSPWSARSIAEEFARPLRRLLVAVDDTGNIGGWCCGSLMAGEAELFKIAVTPSLRRRGVATALLQRFETLCLETGCRSCLLEVRVANRSAIAFYEKLGYSKIGCREKYYTAPQDDALILRKILLAQT